MNGSAASFWGCVSTRADCFRLAKGIDTKLLFLAFGTSKGDTVWFKTIVVILKFKWENMLKIIPPLYHVSA
jgi:hypothetical protein